MTEDDEMLFAVRMRRDCLAEVAQRGIAGYLERGHDPIAALGLVVQQLALDAEHHRDVTMAVLRDRIQDEQGDDEGGEA